MVDNKTRKASTRSPNRNVAPLQQLDYTANTSCMTNVCTSISGANSITTDLYCTHVAQTTKMLTAEKSCLRTSYFFHSSHSLSLTSKKSQATAVECLHSNIFHFHKEEMVHSSWKATKQVWTLQPDGYTGAFVGRAPLPPLSTSLNSSYCCDMSSKGSCPADCAQQYMVKTVFLPTSAATGGQRVDTKPWSTGQQRVH